MPDKKISELVNLTSLATDDEFVVVDKGANATKRITATNLSKFPSGVTVPDAGTIGSASDPDAMAISSGGVVTFSQGIALAAGKGIDFSAYGAGATIDSNLLDDYEEGTWTPAYNNLTIGNATVKASYVKIAKIVTLTYEAILGSTTTIGTFPQIGLPFEPREIFSTDVIATDTGLTYYNLIGRVSTGIYIGLYAYGTSGQVANVTATHPFTWVTTDRIQFSITYEVD